MPNRVVVAGAFLLFLFANSRALGAQNNHPVKLAELLTLIERADRVVVYSDRRTLYSSSSATDIADLRSAISISPPEAWFRCACIPSLEIRLSRKDK